jgi:hypothetical protein
MTVVISDPRPYHYSVTCWNDDCREGLDTYGRDRDEIIAMATEHVERNGCTLNIQVNAIIEVKPS